MAAVRTAIINQVAAFSHVAALHALLIYHMLGGIEELCLIFGFAVNDQYQSSQDVVNLVPSYVRQCLAAFLLGGHVGGTAQKQLHGGKQPFMGALVMLLGQCFMLWSLVTGLLDPDFLPSIYTFFAVLCVALVWTTLVCMDELLDCYMESDNGSISLSKEESHLAATHSSTPKLMDADDKVREATLTADHLV